jgi:hypothetical protein
VKYKAPRHQYAPEYLPAISRREPPGFDLLSVIGMGIAMFSGGILLTQIFPHAQMSRDYLALLGQGQDLIEAGLRVLA